MSSLDRGWKPWMLLCVAVVVTQGSSRAACRSRGDAVEHAEHGTPATEAVATPDRTTAEELDDSTPAEDVAPPAEQVVPPAAVTAEPPGSADSAIATRRESHGFPVPDGLEHLCGQSVLGGAGDEIVWDLFWSAKEPAVVAASYRDALGTEGLEEEDGEWTWRVPPTGDVERVVNVMTQGRRHPDCGTPVPAAARTVVVLSEMHRPGP